MKNTLLLLICLQICSIIACKGPDPDPDPAYTDVSGVYSGFATVRYIEERQYYGSLDTTVFITLRDDTLAEVVTVSAVNLETQTYKITRSTYNNTPYNDYDFARPDNEYKLSNSFSWSIGYEYDKEWKTNLQFHPDIGKLSASISERGIFMSTAPDPDSLGDYEYRTHYDYRLSSAEK